MNRRLTEGGISMGIARGRFVINTHVHSLRLVVKWKERGTKPDFVELSQSLRGLGKLDIPQDDLNLILGGNAVKLFKLEDKMPHPRMCKQFLL